MGPIVVAVFLAVAPAGLESARDRQDRTELQRMALVSSYLAEVALELRDRKLAEQAAVRGVRAAEQAVALKPNTAEFYRVLGTLCGQVVPANVLAGLSYGKRAKDAIDKAIALDPKSAAVYLARGVGNYYLPAALGGGLDLAIADFRQAITLDPKDAEAFLWLGLALRKQNKDADARQAFAKSVTLNPQRVWAKQQLDKTP